MSRVRWAVVFIMLISRSSVSSGSNGSRGIHWNVPLVENAVKHGIAHKQLGGDVAVRARVERIKDEGRRLLITIEDTGAGATPQALQRGRSAGVGLRNLERRLECQYGTAASVSIRTTPGEGTVVDIRLPVTKAAADPDVHQVAS